MKGQYTIKSEFFPAYIHLFKSLIIIL